MRLLIVSTWWPYPLDNGSRVRAFHLIRDLAARYEVTLLSFGRPGGGEELGPLGASCAHVEVVPPVVLDRGGLGLTGLLSATPRHFAQTDNMQMRAHVRALAATHDAALGLQIDAARYLAEIPSVPRVFDEVEVSVPREQYTHAASLRARLRHGLTWWKFRRYVSTLIGRVERATVVSEIERAAVGEMGCDVSRIDVVPNGVEVLPLAPRPARVHRLIYPGAVTFSANLDAVRYFVAQILPIIRQKHPALEFWVTGATDGVDIDDLKRAGVVFTGRLLSVDALVAESAACVVPLRVGGGTRLKILQAMALGTPVVSTRKGAEGLLVQDEHHLLLGDNPDRFAEHVDRVITDPALGARLRDAAWALARERYDWSVIGSGLSATLAAAIADHRSPGGQVLSAASARSRQVRE